MNIYYQLPGCQQQQLCVAGFEAKYFDPPLAVGRITSADFKVMKPFV